MTSLKIIIPKLTKPHFVHRTFDHKTKVKCNYGFAQITHVIDYIFHTIFHKVNVILFKHLQQSSTKCEELEFNFQIKLGFWIIKCSCFKIFTKIFIMGIGYSCDNPLTHFLFWIRIQGFDTREYVWTIKELHTLILYSFL